MLWAQESEAQHHEAAKQESGAVKLYIKEFRVQGAKNLPRVAVERAVYPYLGPGRTEADVEAARAALEKMYRDCGFQTVSVEVPPQDGRNGIIVLQAVEMTVGRLRVKGARYYLPSDIKRNAPSLREGGVIDFNAVTQDIVALNQRADLRVTPSLRPGVEPGTVDVDLEVKDTMPLHGSLEFNNRYSADTTELRLNGAVRYDNLWQLNHTAGAGFQLSPEDLGEVKVFSGYYIARFSQLPSTGFMLQGTYQDSNVSTLGGVAVAGKGETIGPHVLFTLPNGKNFYHTFNFGIDYKHYDNNVVLAGEETVTPISYYPFSAAYGAVWATPGSTTELNGSLNFHLRGMGSGGDQFDNSRYNAQGDYIYFRGDLSHSHDLPGGFQVFGKVQGQISDQPLLTNEQFCAGGLTTVRGYLESAAMGDNAIGGTVELRTPPVPTWKWMACDEWRFYVFADAAALTLRDALPEQESYFKLASWGVGSRVRLAQHYSGSLDMGVPMVAQGTNDVHDLLFTFRLFAEF